MGKIKSFVTVIAIILSVFFMGQTAGAEEAGSGLQISPTRHDLVINPGEAKDITLSIKNVTSGSLKAVGNVNDFTSDNQTGAPQLILESDRTTPYSLKDKISGIEDVVLEPGQSQDIVLSISMPVDSAPGAYFSAVRYSAVPNVVTQENSPQVALTASLTSLILVTVPGEIIEDAKVTNFEVKKGFTQNCKDSDYNAILALQNLGNNYSQPFGKVTLSRGTKEVYSYELNNTNPRGSILPNSSRSFCDSLKNISRVGKYTVTADIAYTSGGQLLTATTSFWYIPKWVYILAIVILQFLILAILITVFYKKRKK